MKNVLITGANRGLGLEFVRQYLESGRKVLATCRDFRVAFELLNLKKEFNGRLEILDLDLSSDDSINKLSEVLSDTPIDLFVNNAGIMGVRNLKLGEVSGGSWEKVFRVNTIAPVLLVQNLLENICLGNERKMIFISSRVGSIQENTGGAMYAYRSSKTALNQVVKSFSIDLLDRGVSSIALHPGWVLTDMGGPNALIDVKTSVTGMISVINSIRNSDSGKFFNYDGSIIKW